MHFHRAAAKPLLRCMWTKIFTCIIDTISLPPTSETTGHKSTNCFNNSSDTDDLGWYSNCQLIFIQYEQAQNDLFSLHQNQYRLKRVLVSIQVVYMDQLQFLRSGTLALVKALPLHVYLFAYKSNYSKSTLQNIKHSQWKLFKYTLVKQKKKVVSQREIDFEKIDTYSKDNDARSTFCVLTFPSPLHYNGHVTVLTNIL